MKKLLLITVLSGAALSASSQSFMAGTHYSMYSDISPDTLLNYVVSPYTHETFAINLFGDGSNDIELVAHGAVSSGGSAAYISATSLNPNVYISQGRLDSVFVMSTSMWNVTKVAKPLMMGQTIEAASAMWDNTTLYLTDHSGSGGGNKDVNDFIGGEKYLGLKYQSGSDISYGWIRVKCTSEDSCYVMDYSSAPASVGIEEIKATEMSLFPNPVTDQFSLLNINNNTFEIGKLKVMDLFGREIAFTYQLSNGRIQVNLPSEQPDGYYFVQYISEDASFSGKLLKITK